MLVHEIDFHRVFKVSPTAMALLTPDFVIVDVNEEFLTVVGRTRDEVIGQKVFEKFPKTPSDPAHPQCSVLQAAVASGEREAQELIRYDFEDPGRPGVFEERYWSAVVTPIRDPDGTLELLELSAREVTPIIAQFRALELQEG